MTSTDIKKTIKARFLTGLFVTFPLALSILAVVWLFELLDSILGRLLYRVLGHDYTGLGFVLSGVGIYIIGIIATTVFGKRIIAATERAMLRVPVFKSFYSTFKQLGDAFSPDNRSAFKKFVLVEYPRQGAQAFGFLTKECIIRNNAGQEECYSTVYIPTNHLYLGDVCLFRKEEVIVTSISIEDGIKIILSAGIAAPNEIVKINGNNKIYSDKMALAGKENS